MTTQRIAVITGAAGGIGAATAGVFTEAGWYVIGLDRRELPSGLQVSRYIASDVSLPDSVEQAFANIQGHEGRIDVLINNAAVQVCKPLLETTLEEWDSVMGANVRAVYLTLRAAFPLMESGSSIVNVSSVHALATSSGIAAYAASKGALLALTRAMALELGGRQIRVNAVLPGAVETPMLHAGLGRGHVEGRSLDELVRGLGRKHVMGRVGLPQEIGRTILFLADSEWSSFITGQAVVVDGGATARLSTE
jgi:NAD(P)-dependent dehydrogenase (short-subunit alcohol dehydrogenase family)